jgi:hypothetical protein
MNEFGEAGLRFMVADEFSSFANTPEWQAERLESIVLGRILTPPRERGL